MVFLGIGSNLSSDFGDRFENINLAISFLESYGIKILKKSSFYETPSHPDKTKPKFINIVVMIETYLNPIDLMSVLIFVEEKLQRKRSLKNDPRTCDIDIIDYQGQTLTFKYNDSEFILPHKEMKERTFVLIPLNEIFPEWKHPITNDKVEVLINKLTNEDKNSILKIKKD